MNRINYSRNAGVLLLLIVFIFVTSPLLGDVDARENESSEIITTTLTIDPNTSNIFVGDSLSVDITVSDVSDLYGVSLEITFDPTVVIVVDADPGETGVQIGEGSCPVADFVVFNEVNNTTGVINYDISSLWPSEPCNGIGVVASITFQGLGEGSSAVHFNNWLLSNTDGISIETSTQDGSIAVAATNQIFLPLVLK